jgi:DNA polymerase-3 subunit beta
MGLPAEEFPPFAKAGQAKSLKLEQSVLADLLKKTAYAASADETRYVLNGVHMTWKGDKLTVVSTDGRRLALVEQDIEAHKGIEVEFTIPTKAVAELQRLLGDKGQVNLAVSENQMVAQFDSTTLTCRLVEGTYPNYRQVIPSEAKERVALERELFLAALHRASLLVSEKTQSVKLNFSKNKLTITATTPEVGEAQETMDVNYKSKDLSIGFNAQYLMDPLRILDADEVFLELTDEISPGVLKINAPFLYVLMPMRLSA